MKSFASLMKSLKARVFAYVTMDNQPFFGLLSPVLVSLRLSDGFVRNVFVLMSGTTIAMVVPVVASPVLTRLYTPEDFGVFALYVAIISAAAVIVEGGYNAAIVLPEHDSDAVNLTGLSISISLLLGVLLFVVSWFVSNRAGILLNNAKISPWLLSVPLAAVVIGLQNTFSLWVNRKRQFKKLAANRIVESVATPGLSIGLGIYSSSVSGLVIGLIIGKILATVVLAREFWQRKRDSRLPVRWATMAGLARKYRDFPFFSVPAAFLDIFALQIPVLFVAKSFGVEALGWFALTTRVIGAPLILLSSCVAQVYYQWIAEANHRNEPGSYVLRIAVYMSLLVLGPLVIVVLFAPLLFSIIFGEEWRVAGEYARILIFPLAIKFVVSPLSVVMPASGNIRLGAIWKISYFISTCAVLYLASHFGIRTFLYIYAGHELVLYAVHFLLISKVSVEIGRQGDNSRAVSDSLLVDEKMK